MDKLDDITKKRFAKLHEYVRNAFEKAPGCHGFDHVERVLENAKRIAEREANADYETVVVGALLHDIARTEEIENAGQVCHAVRGAEMIPDVLRQFEYSDDHFVDAITAIVLRHRYRGEAQPTSVEEKIVYDADKLDSLGAVGLGRAFHFAGRIGAKLHNSEEEALNSESYSKEDTAYREYLVKLRHIPNKMLTKTGREIALRRAGFMSTFFQQFHDEIRHE